MIDDLLKSAKESIIERLTSPLLGSFAIACALWNYKFIVILFSENSVTQTFNLIHSIVFTNNLDIFINGILLPLSSTLAYVFLYPYPAKFVYGFTLNRQREINQLRQKIENETLLSIEESRKIRSRYIELDRKSRDEIENLNKEISKLKDINQQFIKQPSSQEDSNSTEDEKISDSQLNLLKTIENEGGKTTLEVLINQDINSKIQTEYDIEELQIKKLIEKKYNERISNYEYEFTHDGRRVILTSKK